MKARGQREQVLTGLLLCLHTAVKMEVFVNDNAHSAGHLFACVTYETGIIIPILQMRKVEPRNEGICPRSHRQ